MGLENFVGRKIIELHGVRIENPNIRNNTFALFLVAATASRITRSRFPSHGFTDGMKIANGEAIPKEGPVILVVAPHVSLWDPPMAYYAVAGAAHRSMRMIAADYTVDPNIPQDPEELKRTGKKPHPMWRRRIIAALSNIGGPISFNRSNGDPNSDEFIRTQAEIDETLDSGQILAVALQETRQKPGVPNPARVGAARIATRHPEVPVVVLGLTGMENNFGPVVAILSDRFTVAEMDVDLKRMSGLMAVHDRIVRVTASVLSPQAAIDLMVRGKDLRAKSRLPNIIDIPNF